MLIAHELLKLDNVHHHHPSDHLAKPVFMRGTAVHQGLSDDRQTGVDDRALLNVEHTVWIGDHIHPEPQRQTRVTHDNVAIVTELYSELCKSVQHPKFEGQMTPNENNIKKYVRLKFRYCLGVIHR